MRKPDFNQKNLEWIRGENQIETDILNSLQELQGQLNTGSLGPEYQIYLEQELNAVEIFYKATIANQNLEGIYWPCNIGEYIIFLNKYNLRDYLDISKL